MAARFDAIVVGLGQAGPSLAARLAGAGMQVAVIERHHFGGTCVNDGCTPTKAMVASAYAAHMVRRASEFGVMSGAISQVDMKRVKARKDAIVLNSRSGLERWIGGLSGVTVYRGHARLVGRNEIQVGPERLTAERIFLNVGARATVPDMPGLRNVAFLTSATLLDLDVVPEHLLVVGGSYVGLEFAQMFRRFGSRVTVVERGPRLAGREDEDVSLEIQRIFAGEGIELRLAAECLSARQEPGGVSIGVRCDDGAPRESGTHLLLAVGRTPNTDDLGLHGAGIAMDERGYIEVDDQLRTSNPHVWAMGDCNGRGAFTHTAYNDYEIVADNVLHEAGRSCADRIPVYALFTDPPLGRVGMSEAEIRKSGLRVLVAKRPMSRVGRAVEKGETHGFLKIHVEQDTHRILGAALLGTGADESVQSLLEAMYSRLPFGEFQCHVRIHPTVSELLPTVLENLSPLDGS